MKGIYSDQISYMRVTVSLIWTKIIHLVISYLDFYTEMHKLHFAFVVILIDRSPKQFIKNAELNKNMATHTLSIKKHDIHSFLER